MPQDDLISSLKREVYSSLPNIMTTLLKDQAGHLTFFAHVSKDALYMIFNEDNKLLKDTLDVDEAYDALASQEADCCTIYASVRPEVKYYTVDATLNEENLRKFYKIYDYFNACLSEGESLHTMLFDVDGNIMADTMTKPYVSFDYVTDATDLVVSLFIEGVFIGAEA
jgi:hypothetical protein